MIHDTTPADRGYAAFGQGAQACECPYPPGTTEANVWTVGWQKAANDATTAHHPDHTRCRCWNCREGRFLPLRESQ